MKLAERLEFFLECYFWSASPRLEIDPFVLSLTLIDGFLLDGKNAIEFPCQVILDFIMHNGNSYSATKSEHAVTQSSQPLWME